jgi:phosphohistidine phosphatase
MATLRLLLLRHLKSSRDDPSLDDFDRPLAKKGRKAGKLVKEHLKEKVKEHSELKPELILCSSAVRTRETLESVESKTLLRDTRVLFERSIYEATREAIARTVLKNVASGEGSEPTKTVMLVGHNPGMEDLALWLVGDGEGSDPEGFRRMKEKYPTGALAILSCSSCDWKDALDAGGKWKLDSFVTPKDLGGGEDD